MSRFRWVACTSSYGLVASATVLALVNGIAALYSVVMRTRWRGDAQPTFDRSAKRHRRLVPVTLCVPASGQCERYAA
jgi:hypothetical protein